MEKQDLVAYVNAWYIFFISRRLITPTRVRKMSKEKGIKFIPCDYNRKYNSLFESKTNSVPNSESFYVRVRCRLNEANSFSSGV
jgi:hypothetical protein